MEFARTGPPEGFPAFPDIPGGRYTSDEFFELETRHLWTKVWVMAGRAEDVADPGDYFTFDDLGVPIAHRARRRRRDPRVLQHLPAPRRARSCARACGSARSLRCQYHSWTYDITDGG